MNRLRAALAAVLLLPLLSLGAAPVGAALSASGGGLRQVAIPGGDLADCTFTGGSANPDGWEFSSVGPAPVGVDHCDGSVGKATFRVDTRTASRILVMWYTGSPGTGLQAYLFVRPDGILEFAGLGGSCGILGSGFGDGESFSVSWSLVAGAFEVTRPSGMTLVNSTCSFTAVATEGLTLALGGEPPGTGMCDCQVVLDDIQGSDWADIDPGEEEEPCPSWTPSFLCDAATGIGDFTGPITDALGGVVSAIGDLASTLLGAIGDLGNTLVAAIGTIASQIWEVFKQVVLDPEEVGAWWDGFYEQMQDSSAATWVSGADAVVRDAVPDVQSGTINGLCVRASVCLGPALSEMPGPAEVMLTVLLYVWAFITLCYSAGQVVKTVRR